MISGNTHNLFENASGRIRQYNDLCLHYNLVADAVYQELRKSRAPFSAAYERYLIAALISFDMGRMMGKGLTKRYKVEDSGFAAKLHRKLLEVRTFIQPVIESSVVEVDFDEHASNIAKAYSVLASGGKEGLHDLGNEFHVGATKLLHFLNPELFTIIDGNTASTLRRMSGIPYRNATQPGYSEVLYVRSLAAIKDLIVEYGVVRFRSLEHGTPLMRIVDKVAFVQDGFA